MKLTPPGRLWRWVLAWPGQGGSVFLILFISCCHCNNLPQLGGWKQSKWIIVQFWRSEDLSGTHWANVKVSARLCSLLEALGKETSCLSQLLEAACSAWLVAPSSIFKASNGWLSPSHFPNTVPPPSSTFQDPVITLDHLNNPGSYPFLHVSWLTTLMPSTLLIPPCHVTCHSHKFLGLGQGHVWGTTILPITLINVKTCTMNTPTLA